jgi:integrase
VDAEPPLLARNPAVKAKPPTAKEAQPPEMHPWTADQLRVFLDWSGEHSDLHAAWWVLSYTGMRRGELLALRWRDIDMATGTIAIRRSAGVVRNKGEGAEITEGTTKTNKPRVIDIDPVTVAALKGWRSARAGLSRWLVRHDSLVFGDINGHHLHPERFSRTFKTTLAKCRRQLKETAPPEIRLHDLRHTHATILLADLRENIKVVSERLGHASVTVTLTVYSHVMPGNQRQAVSRFAEHMGRAA